MRSLILAAGGLLLVIPPARAVDKSVIDRAVDRGVAALKAAMGPDGRWAAPEIGATALAGLALLECGVPKEDKVIQNALAAVRGEGLALTHTYSLALSVLFLDKYNDRADTPLIESMIVRLLAGQKHSGGWSYNCPNLAPAEQARIKLEMEPEGKGRAGRNLDKLPEKGKRRVADLPDAIRAQLEVIARAAVAEPPGYNSVGDNSNTQFATLALWVGRRYGVPTQDGLVKVAERFRRSQNADGGWSYIPMAGNFGPAGIGASTAAMTCSGLLGLACGHGGVLDKKKARDAKVETIDVSKDDVLKRGIAALGTAVGKPIGWNGAGAAPATIPAAKGRAYYFLWSLERVAVTLNLETIGGKDWYNWGAEILLASQDASGLWIGQDAIHGNADTSFALLFLKKANLARDLSGALTGLKDAGRVLRGGLGPTGKGALAAPGLGEKGKPGGAKAAASKPPRLAPPVAGVGRAEKPRPVARTDEEKEAVRLGDEALNGSEEERADALRKLRDSKGVAYTEALVWVISRLEGDALKQARDALGDRCARLKETTLREYLKDDEPEIRRAAALAAAHRGSKVLIPDLIRCLSDREDFVRRAAHVALKELSGKDFGPAPGAGVSERKESIAAWLRWWKERARE